MQWNIIWLIKEVLKISMINSIYTSVVKYTKIINSDNNKLCNVWLSNLSTIRNIYCINPWILISKKYCCLLNHITSKTSQNILKNASYQSQWWKKKIDAFIIKYSWTLYPNEELFLSRKLNPNLNGNRYSQWKLLQESTSME